MSFPRYPNYKNSGVEWFADVPEHWEVIRLKNVLECRITDGPHTTPEFINEGVPFLSVDGIQAGELVFEGCRYISEEDYEEYRKKAQPTKNDLLMGKAASTGKIARVKTDTMFSIWSPLALIRVDSSQWSPAFYEQALKSVASQAQIEVLCTSNTQKNISMDDIPRLTLTRPPHDEQIIIANFLDHETAKIDNLIAEQKRLIELLQEKRQAVISHAVTKGLNPAVPMKDSGVEWLGEVPEHWDVKPLKHLATIQTGMAKGKELEGVETTEIPYLRVANVQDGYLDLETLHHLKVPVSSVDRYLLQKGDVLMNEGGDFDKLGRGCIWNSEVDPCVHQNHVFAVRPHSISGKWLNTYTSSRAANSYFISRSKQSTNLASISSTNLMGLPVPVPPREEVREIFSRMSERVREIDGLRLSIEYAVGLLIERRSALISAAVTGQIDVRGLSAMEVAA